MQKSIFTQTGNTLQLLQRFDLERLAKETGCYLRKPRKLSILLFTAAILDAVLKGKALSLRKQALNISLMGGITYAKQSFAQRIRPATAVYMRAVLGLFISEAASKDKVKGSLKKAFKLFNRVLIQDSTCVKLHPSLAPHFPGASNHTGKKLSTLKLQATFDLMRNSLVDFSLSGFRRNDQTASSDILAICQKGDLILRDLGYFVLEVLAKIDGKKAWFISRYETGVCIYDPDTRERLCLLELLNQQGCVDQAVLLGQKQQLPVRLVAVRVPPNVANERRRKANANRDRRSRASKEKRQLMGWSVFVTNLKPEAHSRDFIVQAYASRWRIETLFKAYKQHLSLRELAPGSLSYVHIQIYAKLCWISLAHRAFNELYPLKPLSFVKFTEVFSWLHCSGHIGNLLRLDMNELKAWIAYFSKYEKRKRPHFFQKLKALS